MQKLLYFDNAATTWPKPPSVIAAVSDAMKNKSGNPGRGSHKLSSAASELLYDCRETAASMFGAQADNVVFTLNATQALNMAIKGLARDNSHILIDSFAHNAAYRPVMSLKKRGCTAEIYDASGDDSNMLDEITSKIRPNTRMVIASHQSNICSKVLPIRQIGELCARYGIPFIVDASQSAGHMPINLTGMKITALCLPGHKGLYGPMGCGMLISAPDVHFETIIEGGAGINSLDVGMPEELPERLEAGTVALPAIAGLLAGMRWVQKIGIERIHEHEAMLASYFTKRASLIDGVKLTGPCEGSVISFCISGILPSEIGEVLNRRGICVRTGYHCAPLGHKTLGTMENGTVRLGFSFMNRLSEIDVLLESLRQDFR